MQQDVPNITAIPSRRRYEKASHSFCSLSGNLDYLSRNGLALCLSLAGARCSVLSVLSVLSVPKWSCTSPKQDNEFYKIAFIGRKSEHSNVAGLYDRLRRRSDDSKHI